MNPRYIAIIIGLLLLSAIGIFISNNTSTDEITNDNLTACTQEARQCPDGSFVGRSGPDCEFASCPVANEDTSSNTETTNETSNIIKYTNNGFEPKTITIKKGDTVRFVNEGGLGMWVASDIHPTHSIYPEKSDSDCLGSAFDQCSASGKDTFYEFTFDEVGSWKFHNHVRANHTGTIIVTE